MKITVKSGAKATLREVAHRAQVHHATASTILNGSRGSTRVSPETRERVLKAANDLGYTANRAAQQLKTRRSNVVGLLTGALENPFFARMVSLCSAALEAEGFEVVMATRWHDETSDLHLLESLLPRDLAGIIVWSEALSEAHERLERSGMSNVVVMGINIAAHDSIGADLRTGVEEAMAHLRRQGYRRIAYFAPQFALNRPGDLRDLVYRETMAAWGEQERIISYDGAAYDTKAARLAAEKLAGEMLAQPEEERPDALLCFNDMNALGAMMGLRRRGMSIPGDIGLVGCDNLPIVDQLDVPLTSVHYPLEPMCRTAVRWLAERVRAEQEGDPAGQQPARSELLATRLCERESTQGRTTNN